jgi:hypothetical protein
MTSISKHHIEWLSLIEVSGPFLSIPILNESFPQGLDAQDTDLTQDLRAAHEEWLDNQLGLKADPQVHQAWILYVLERVLGWENSHLLKDEAVPEQFTARIEDRLLKIRPDMVLIEPGQDDPQAVMLIQTYPQDQKLDQPPQGDHAQESIQTRMMMLLHALDIPLGLLTNGRAWMLVYAPKGETTSFITWYAHLWLEEPLTLRAFYSLLHLRRFLGVPEDQTLVGLLKQSAENQQAVTTQLGGQVRSAIETLIRSLDAADRDRGRTLLNTVSESVLFEAALTVMMRLVFLLSAEERNLFPVDDPLYKQNYSVLNLRGQLRDKADHFGKDVLDYQYDAWSRLLAVFRMVYAGSNHDRLQQPAYGGSLFYPDRFPFLEGRPVSTQWQETPANPLPINNRTILHILDALKTLQVDVPGGGKQAQQISFRALDIEQIGHVYESLLDHQLKRAMGVVVGLQGTKNKEPEVPLEELEKRNLGDEEMLIDYLEEMTGRSQSALENDLHREPDLIDLNRLQVACENDAELLERVRPFFALLREDDFGRIMVIPDESFYLTEGNTRRSTGTHYTPRSLTEPIVQHTLDPQIYHGPAEGLPREEWVLWPPRKLLDLKICDMAMGSGAFLVQVVRYLGDRLVESWARFAPIEPLGPNATDYDMYGDITDDPAERLPRDGEERRRLARRLVATRCIYGVDKNPLAVEMAKLSLWLVTLAKGRPFGFLDHALKCGDSLVGTDAETFRCWAREISGSVTSLFDQELAQALEEAHKLRKELESFEARDIQDIFLKEKLFEKAKQATQKVRTGADFLAGLDLMELSDQDRQRLKGELLISYIKGVVDTPQAQIAIEKAQAERAFHWFLEFPEVFENGGFDAFIGNPPFMGGTKISTNYGDYYYKYVRRKFTSFGGRADFCVLFFLQAYDKAKHSGSLGLVATNSISDGDSKVSGFKQIIGKGGHIYRSKTSFSWPGTASVVVSVIHIYKGDYSGRIILNEKQVNFIGINLDDIIYDSSPFQLSNKKELYSTGSKLDGTGFILSENEADQLLNDTTCTDVIYPYLTGEDLNQNPNQKPSRFVIYFADWSEKRAKNFPQCYEILKERVKPQRKSHGEKRAREKWWQFQRIRKELYDKAKKLDRVLVRPRVSNTHAPCFVEPNIIFSEANVVFLFAEFSYFAVLQSSFHESWAEYFGSTLGRGIRYTATDVFETYVFPNRLHDLEEIGKEYHETRQKIMNHNNEGLTDTYNRFNNPTDENREIQNLRKLHMYLDNDVLTAYGWNDIKLDHDFHATDLGIRFTICERARKEVLIRLLKLNHQRYGEEVLAGFHGKKAKRNWIKEHGQPYEVSKKSEQLAFIEDEPNQGLLIDENDPGSQKVERKPVYYRCWGCGKLLTAEERDIHTTKKHSGKDPGYASIGR